MVGKEDLTFDIKSFIPRNGDDAGNVMDMFQANEYVHGMCSTGG